MIQDINISTSHDWRGLVESRIWGALQHLHEEGVDGSVADQLVEEQVLQTLETDGTESGETQQELGEPAGLLGMCQSRVLF